MLNKDPKKFTDLYRKFALSVQIGTILQNLYRSLQICTENLKFSTELLNLRDLYRKFKNSLQTCKTIQI